MNAQKLSKKVLLVAFITTMGLQGCGKSGSGQGVEVAQDGSVYREVGAGEELFTNADNVSADPQGTEDEGRSLRKRFVHVNISAFKKMIAQARQSGVSEGKLPEPVLFKVKLFDNETVQVNLEEIQVVSENNIIVTGQIAGDPDSAVTFVLNNDVLVANIRRGDSNENYEIRYKGNGLHTIRVPDETDEAEADHQCEAMTPPEGEDNSADAMNAENQNENGESSVMAAPVIDMLVAYTPIARSRQGGTTAIKALIQMGIADTNRAFADSGVSASVRLVGTMELSRNETGNYHTDLAALRSKTDSKWNEVHTARARLGADQVTVVGAYPSAASVGGVGYVKASYASAFSIVKMSLFRMYTFSHELGHNIGLNHSDGYVNSAGRFRTIIAYGTYPRIRRYSNPNLAYNGYRTGTAAKNESLILRNNVARMAALSPAKVAAATVTAADLSNEAPAQAAHSDSEQQ